MKNWMIYGIVGGFTYWLWTKSQEVIPPGQPAQTTGAPQPQGVQGHEPAIVDHYDLQAFPMGAFADRR